MTEQPANLALTFLESHPAAAARILEQRPVREVASFLAWTPPDYAAPVLQRMAPQVIARLCRQLDTSTAAALLRPLDTGLVTAVLRNLKPKLREGLLQEFSMARRGACQLLLRYSENTVGAWMTPEVITVADDTRAAEALAGLTNADSRDQTGFLFVVGRDRALRGRLHYAQLLRASEGQPVTGLLEASTRALPGMISIRQAAAHPDWSDYDVLPVVDRKHRFIGALRHSDLRRALAQIQVRHETRVGEDPLSGLIDVYGHCLLALFDTLGDFSDPDVLPEEVRS